MRIIAVPAVSALVLLLALPGSLEAQWSVGLSLGVARYFGGAVSAVDSTPGEVHPSRPTTVGLVVGRDWEGGRWRTDLAVSYASPGLAAEIPGGTFVDTRGARFFAVSPEVTYRLFGIGDGTAGALRVGGGGDLTLWDLTGFDQRMILGGHLTAVYEWPIAGRLLGGIQAGLSVSRSVFNADEVDSSFERRMLVRPSVSIGIRYR